MHAQYEASIKEANNYKDDDERNQQLFGLKQINDRRQQRVDRLFARLESQVAEFEDLNTHDVLVTKTHAIVDYWSDRSLQERRRLQNRTQKYLELSDASIKAVGGSQNILRALTRSQDFSVIDVSKSNLLTSKDIISVVNSVKSVTGVALLRDDDEIYKAVMSNVQAIIGGNRDVCLYTNVVVSHNYRWGKPYLLCHLPGASVCKVYFYIEIKCNHIVTLQHAVPEKNGKVNVKLNGHELELRGQRPISFTSEDIHLPNEYLNDVGRPNTLEIIVDNESGSIYCLSDVYLPIRPDPEAD
ncbi:hypothetical protein D9619_000532 [Psilocybe cf. subviscida]|uniref:Uncharacterized protein n=1 Tax=Psilocybe cf. subviscida TaxID=2480587 RepID=A0A8H5BDM1_9AGAR|nr:hypothetical protein D9619_000532 [Psilocybe cf. subviscida]